MCIIFRFKIKEKEKGNYVEFIDFRPVIFLYQ